MPIIINYDYDEFTFAQLETTYPPKIKIKLIKYDIHSLLTLNIYMKPCPGMLMLRTTLLLVTGCRLWWLLCP